MARKFYSEQDKEVIGITHRRIVKPDSATNPATLFVEFVDDKHFRFATFGLEPTMAHFLATTDTTRQA